MHKIVRYWYILLLHKVAMVVKTFAVHQPVETGIEEISVKVEETHQDGLMNFIDSSEMPTSQVLLQWSEDMEITWCGARAVWCFFQNLPFETLYRITRY